LGSRRLKAQPETSLSILAETEITFHEVGGLVAEGALGEDLLVEDLPFVVTRVVAGADGFVGGAGFVAAEAPEGPNSHVDRTPRVPPPAPPTTAAEISAVAVVNAAIRVRLEPVCPGTDCFVNPGVMSRLARLNIEVSIARMCPAAS
jgi:hypothetical protein